MFDKILIICYRYLLIIFVKFGFRGDFIQRKLERKLWLDERSRKLQNNKNKEKKTKKHKNSQAIIKIRNRSIFRAPSNFSIENNPDETIEFYNQIITKRDEYKIGHRFYIDSSAVTEVTVDAILYLVSIVADTKSHKVFRYMFEGNLPNEESAKSVYIESGFLSFVHSKDNLNIKPLTNRIKIAKGETVDSPIAAQVCEFVQNKCGFKRKDTIPLYNILVELMENTKQHAYSSKNIMTTNSWLIYAEETKEMVKFIFLDTGLGIPTTVRKRFGEKIPIFLKNDSEFIKSALNGDDRTETGVKYRGKGLPQILECFKYGLLKNLIVFSGKGICKLIDNSENFYLKDYRNKIFGTLFCWYMLKEREKEND